MLTLLHTSDGNGIPYFSDKMSGKDPTRQISEPNSKIVRKSIQKIHTSSKLTYIVRGNTPNEYNCQKTS